MIVVHSRMHNLWILTPRVIIRPEARTRRPRSESGPSIYHETWRHIIYFSDFHFGSFPRTNIQNSEEPKTRSPRSESGPYINGDTWKQIVDFGSFPLGDFHTSHLKLPKSQRSKSEVNLDHPSDGTRGRQIITLVIFLWEVPALTVETPEAQSVEAHGNQ
jgi:hypothetical protein